MDHVAIMRKNWGLLPKILSGEKKIESRWYKSKYRPWNKIGKGDMVYFKNSGEPVTLRAQVKKVIQFSDLNPAEVKKLLDKYAKLDGIAVKDIANYYKMFKDKKFCLLIFLKKVQKVKPFQIDKTGFGSMSAWLTVGKIKDLKYE